MNKEITKLTVEGHVSIFNFITQNETFNARFLHNSVGTKGKFMSGIFFSLFFIIIIISPPQKLFLRSMHLILMSSYDFLLEKFSA